ncbi:MAG: Do family serine endopeptidase [Flavobacteriales bacterium]|nr:Do family serine endopeptidase [Flavobacteriales bacterium]
MKRTLSYISMSLAGALLALGIQQKINGSTEPSPVVSNVQHYRPAPTTTATFAARSGSLAMPDLVEAAEMSVNSVVHVTTESMVNVRDPFADLFWGHRAPIQQQPRQGAGSGVIITDDGYIVTNNHVVDGADKIKVHLNDRRSFDARVIGRDPSTDLALLKIDATELNAMGYGDSDDVRVGEWVLAVGNPMSLTSTVTAGIISAKARNINLLQYDAERDIFPIESFLQTDAAVNPGNSGGALVNTSGQLIGINTAIASTTGQYAGYSFAIPVNIVKKVTNDLLEFGSVQRAYIGVSIRDLDQKLAKELKLDRINGVYVNGITDGGAAQLAGLRSGDVIIRIGTMDVNNVPQLQEQVSRYRPGDKVAVAVLRDGKESVMDVTLRGRDGVLTSNSTKGTTQPTTTLGADLRNATEEELRDLKLTSGVKVTAINGGKLRSSGIREGFIITRIDQEPITSVEQLMGILNKKKGGVLVEGVYPNGTKAYYGLGL